MNPDVPDYIDWLPDPTPKGPQLKRPAPRFNKPRLPHRQSMRSVNRNR